MSKDPRFQACRAHLDQRQRLIFEEPDGLSSALKTGFFALKIPTDLDLTPIIKFSKEFYLDPLPNQQRENAKYRGYRDKPSLYFDREHFQTEHILANANQRASALPLAVQYTSNRMHKLAACILRNILDNLGIARHLWPLVTADTCSGGGVKWLAVSHYRPEREMPGAPAHKDTGFVTILYCDQPGLQAKLSDNWVDVQPPNGYFLINFGGSLELLTSRLKSPVTAVIHKVTQCTVNATKIDRHSFAAFLNPPATGTLYSITPDGNNAEPILPVETFLRTFNAETWKDQHSNFGISTASTY
ncbi:2OG-Fe(II) oxygenase family protein [Pseudomonas asiatica]|uniref:2OG-Fe(II) oxygenase family protein n=1 Tax=Pseudomonas asiatica TaxID=2219225 RepID=UPI00383B7BFF